MLKQRFACFSIDGGIVQYVKRPVHEMQCLCCLPRLFLIDLSGFDRSSAVEVASAENQKLIVFPPWGNAQISFFLPNGNGLVVPF